MIADAESAVVLRQHWNTVRQLTSASHRQVQIPGGPFINETPADEFFNLPLVLAYGVLDEVLDELIAQRTFRRSAGRQTLEIKMIASRPHLPWQDYTLVDFGRVVRNKLAHDAVLHSKKECLRYISAIDIEFRAWGIT